MQPVFTWCFSIFVGRSLSPSNIGFVERKMRWMARLELEGVLWEPIRGQGVGGRQGDLGGRQGERGLRSPAKPSCSRPAGRTQTNCWCSLGFPGARLQRKYVQTRWGWGRVVSQPKYQPAWIWEYLWWHRLQCWRGQYLRVFVCIWQNLLEFDSIWQYLSVFLSIS